MLYMKYNGMYTLHDAVCVHVRVINIILVLVSLTHAFTVCVHVFVFTRIHTYMHICVHSSKHTQKSSRHT